MNIWKISIFSRSFFQLYWNSLCCTLSNFMYFYLRRLSIQIWHTVWSFYITYHTHYIIRMLIPKPLILQLLQLIAFFIFTSSRIFSTMKLLKESNFSFHSFLCSFLSVNFLHPTHFPTIVTLLISILFESIFHFFHSVATILLYLFYLIIQWATVPL